MFIFMMSCSYSRAFIVDLIVLLFVIQQLSSSAKIDRWFSLLPANTPALSRPESGFISGVEDGADAATLAEAKNLLQQLGAKKKRRLIPIRFTRRKILVNKHTLL